MHSSALLALIVPLALAIPASIQAKERSVADDKTGYSGDITYYDVGLGSCGWTNTDDEDVVALALPMMQNGANPNNNPICGETIIIDYEGVQTSAKVVDSCYACAYSDVDMSPSLFQKVAPDGDGRVHNVHWWFNSTADGTRPVTS